MSLVCHNKRRKISALNDEKRETIASSLAFRNKLIASLYDDARRGRGTDLEVTCPVRGDRGNCGSTTTFHLHSAVVASSSIYFATFPEPKSRDVNDVDSETFSLCVRFMYLGECGGGLSHGNVASVLHASDLFQVNELKSRCMEYLEHNLDYENYEQVVELATQFNDPQLQAKALRFKTANSARDQLAAKKINLCKQIAEAELAQEQAYEWKRDLQRQLDSTEAQWKEICQRELKQVKLGMSSADSSPWETSLSMKPKFAECGAVSHLVHAGNYAGSTTYLGRHDGDQAEASGESDSDDSYDSLDLEKPPVPTKDQYEKYGILHSHGSIREAIEESNPGDRIYLTRGVHRDRDHFGHHVGRALEFIGMGKAEDIIVEVEYKSLGSPFLLVHSSVAFVNITFRVNSTDEKGDNNAYDAIIEFEEKVQPENHDEALENKLFVKNCIFDLGSDCRRAFPTRVSGLLVKKGKSATIEGCIFSGGAGNAVAVISDPYFYTSAVRIVKNTFIHNGQPTTVSEKSDERSAVWVGDRYEWASKSAPAADEGLQGLFGTASVELWKFDRKGFLIRGRWHREKHMTVSVAMEGNSFVSNLCAPLANRIIIPCKDSSTTPDQYESITKKNTFELRNEIVDGEDLSSVVRGFNLMLKDNTMKDNSLRVPTAVLAGKPTANESKDPEPTAFPDGNSVLVINHFLKSSSDGFPEKWECGEPEANFRKEYLSHIPWENPPVDRILKEEGLRQMDIDLVVSQAGCSRAEAIEALEENDNDIVNAIMFLTT